MGKEIIVEVKHMDKRFGSTIALNDVNIEVRRGEIQGLIGENGSGKSTVTSIISGMQKADKGEMFFKGAKWEPLSMLWALERGVGMIVQENGTLVPSADGLGVLRNKQHITWVKELADASITLVKDTQKLLPVSAEKYPRVLLEILGDFPSNDRVLEQVKTALVKKGFQVTVYEKEDFEKGVDNVAAFRQKYDLAIYIGNVENASNQTTNRINWYTFWGQGNNVPWFVHEVPALFISVANPYHLLDVPMLRTYINCYSNNEFVLDAVVEKITGNSPFKGHSPVDPFCGRKELQY